MTGPGPTGLDMTGSDVTDLGLPRGRDRPGRD